MFKKEEPDTEYHTLTSTASTFKGLCLGKEQSLFSSFREPYTDLPVAPFSASHMRLFHRNMVRYSYTVSIFVWR